MVGIYHAESGAGHESVSIFIPNRCARVTSRVTSRVAILALRCTCTVSKCHIVRTYNLGIFSIKVQSYAVIDVYRGHYWTVAENDLEHIKFKFEWKIDIR